MNYDEALAYIHGTKKFGWKLGLQNITRLTDLLGNPHKKLKFVHVAGTNGKGSTVAFVSSILMASGYKTGIYISPYIERFTERIKIDDTEISPEDLARLTEAVKEKVDAMLANGEAHPTEFEIVTAIALQYYYENHCDIVVLEVGLGGRFDSTNVIDTPLVSVITTISYDHMQFLGNTLPEIAFEKAGIIKEKGDVVLYPQAEEVDRVFAQVSAERHAGLHRIDFGSLRITDFDIHGQIFDYDGYNALKIGLLGRHQPQNAALAVKTAEILRDKGYAITEQTIRSGLYQACWPGRMEVLKKDPVFLVDGAHNPEGAKVLAESLRTYFPEQRKIFILGLSKDKDKRAILEAVAPIAHMFITVASDNERALPADELAIFVEEYCKNVVVGDKIENAVRISLEAASGSDMICAFGSLFYIGKVREILANT